MCELYRTWLQGIALFLVDVRHVAEGLANFSDDRIPFDRRSRQQIPS